MAPIIRISTIRLFRKVLSTFEYVEFQKLYNDIQSTVVKCLKSCPTFFLDDKIYI